MVPTLPQKKDSAGPYLTLEEDAYEQGFKKGRAAGILAGIGIGLIIGLIAGIWIALSHLGYR